MLPHITRYSSPQREHNKWLLPGWAVLKRLTRHVAARAARAARGEKTEGIFSVLVSCDEPLDFQPRDAASTCSRTLPT